jgi:hypothetical protein
MAAHLNEASPAPALEALRQAIRESGEWPEDRAVTRLLHALELTGGARHRAVATAMGLVEGTSGRSSMLSCRNLGCPIKRALRSCALPKRCCAFRMTRPPTA